MAWDVLSGVTKTAWDVLSGMTNRCGMFCPGWQKMAWDVLSRDVLSYIHTTLVNSVEECCISSGSAWFAKIKKMEILTHDPLICTMNHPGALYQTRWKNLFVHKRLRIILHVPLYKPCCEKPVFGIFDQATFKHIF